MNIKRTPIYLCPKTKYDIYLDVAPRVYLRFDAEDIGEEANDAIGKNLIDSKGYGIDPSIEFLLYNLYCCRI